MKTFSSYGNKSAHIKKNNCKAKSIIHAVNPDCKQNLYINGNNNNNNTTINNINNNIINNFGSERTDFITMDEMVKILSKGGDSIVPKYIEFKHFNKNFPENHNIKYEKNNSCLIKINDDWKIINLDYLSRKLLNKNSNEIKYYYTNKKEEIEIELAKKIKQISLIEFINKRFDYLDLCNDKKLYNQLKFEIKDIIKTTIIL